MLNNARMSTNMCSIREFDVKLQALFLQLRTFSNSPIEDDTVLQKLQSNLCKLIQEKENQLVWTNYIGLVTFIRDVLDEDFVKNEKNVAVISFALHCFATLIRKEENFFYLSDHLSLRNFKKALPILRNDMSLSVASLSIVSSMISHASGYAWVMDNKLWEILLIPCLKTQSIFVRRECIQVIYTLLLKISDDQTFCSHIHDLELILYKFREARMKLKQKCEVGMITGLERQTMEANIPQLRFNMYTILLVFYELLLQTLGKKSMYSKLRPTIDLTSKILFRFNFDMSSESFITLSKMLLLSTLHRFQDQLLKFGTAEQFHLDSFTSDLLSICRHMINKGHIGEFLVASFVIHSHWSTMYKNIQERIDAELSKSESIPYLILKFQMTPMKIICNSSLELANEELKNLEQNVLEMNDKAYDNMSIREEHKVEARQLVELMVEKSSENMKEAYSDCITCLSHFLTVLDHFHPNCAVTLFQGLIFFLKFQFKLSSRIDYDPRLLQIAMELLSSLIEKFDMEFEKCCESNLVLTMLTDVVWMPGMNSRVKVATLKAISTCIRKFMPPVMLINIEKMESTDFENLGKSISIYLSDTEWEVRDSALEMLYVCMNLATEKYPFLIDWFLRHNLMDIVLQAFGDIEPYVQASAITLISCIISYEQIWIKCENQGLKELSIRSVIKAGDCCIRKSGLQLISSLFSNSKFSELEVEAIVAPVIQYATGDENDEVRLAALQFIEKHIEKNLVSMGMVDGEFPSVTFHKGKITKLEEEQVNNRVFSVISNICSNGYFRSVLNCYKDNATEVSLMSSKIATFISSLISKYNLQSRIMESSDSNFSVISSNVEDNISLATSVNEEDILDEEYQSREEKKEQGINYILHTNDLEAISRLKNTNFESMNCWWRCGSSNNDLSIKDIPDKLSPLLPRTLFRELEKIACEKMEKPESLSERLESEILYILEDIFLDPELSNDNKESHQRDCY